MTHPSDSIDPRDPSLFLRPGETLLWQGRPDPTGPSIRAVLYVRFMGVLMLLCFLFFVLITWVNRDELEGAVGFIAIFLGLSGGLTVFFLWGVPALSRASLRATRYAVAGHHAIIIRGIFGNREILRYPLPEARQVTVVTDKIGRQDVRFLRIVGRTPPGNMTDMQHGSHRVVRYVAFERLTSDAAHAAMQALDQIKGQAGPDAKLEKQRG